MFDPIFKGKTKLFKFYSNRVVNFAVPPLFTCKACVAIFGIFFPLNFLTFVCFFDSLVNYLLTIAYLVRLFPPPLPSPPPPFLDNTHTWKDNILNIFMTSFTVFCFQPTVKNSAHVNKLWKMWRHLTRTPPADRCVHWSNTRLFKHQTKETRQNTHWPRPIPENLKSARLKSPDPDRWRSANRRVPHLSSLNSQTKRRSWKSAHLPLLTDRFRVSILCIFLKGFFFSARALDGVTYWRHLAGSCWHFSLCRMVS